MYGHISFASCGCSSFLRRLWQWIYLFGTITSFFLSFKTMMSGETLLNQVYVKSVTFPYAPPKCLKWKSRSEAVAKELIAFDADFLCLQELDEFDTFYRPTLSQKGYGALYIKRPGKKKDGSGIFYKKDRFDLVAEEHVDYNDIVEDGIKEGIISPESRSLAASLVSEGGRNKDKNDERREDMNDAVVRFTRDCVGIMGAFREKDTASNSFIVASTHFFWDPALADVKLAQAKHLVKSLHSFRRRLEAAAPPISSIPAFVCGDFNSQPGDPVYTFLTSPSSLTDPVLSLTKVRPTAEIGTEDSDEGLESQPLKKVPRREDQTVERRELKGTFDGFKSVYAEGSSEPKFSTLTPGFTGTLDYVFFHSELRVTIRELLDVPGDGEPSLQGHLPNLLHPSDHLPVGAILEFNP